VQGLAGGAAQAIPAPAGPPCRQGRGSSRARKGQQGAYQGPRLLKERKEKVIASETVSFGTTGIGRERKRGGSCALARHPPALGADRSPAAELSRGTGLGSSSFSCQASS